jgi:hypothetical protein
MSAIQFLRRDIAKTRFITTDGSDTEMLSGQNLLLFLDSEANILDAKKLVWSQVNPKLCCTELFLIESQTSRGEVRNFGLLGFGFKIDLKKNIFG